MSGSAEDFSKNVSLLIWCVRAEYRRIFLQLSVGEPGKGVVDVLAFGGAAEVSGPVADEEFGAGPGSG